MTAKSYYHYLLIITTYFGRLDYLQVNAKIFITRGSFSATLIFLERNEISFLDMGNNS